MSSIILSIEKYEDSTTTFHDGYYIKISNNGYVHVSMSNSQNCCEHWCVSALKNKQNFDKKLNELIGKKIIDIKMDRPDDVDINEDGDEASIVNIKIILENDDVPFIICLYNQHNGFYAHQCLIDWNITIDERKFLYCENINV
jgi:hypothetical protein